MALELRGTKVETRYGYRVVSRFNAWEMTQEDGDDAMMVEVDEPGEEDEFYKHFEPTEIRLLLGAKWMIYTEVERVGDTQYRVTGKRKVQSS